MIGIASDHAGFELKKTIIDFVKSLGYTVKDFGTFSADSMDYPDVAHPLADSILSGEVEKGIAICGTGVGMSMTLNRHDGVRAALCWAPEIAVLARNHNDANALALPARFIKPDVAIKVVESFLYSKFEGGRHLRRIEKIECHQ